MVNIPFTIRCTTCKAKLAVRSAALIGQVLACPKCQSMVLVEEPEESQHLPDEAAAVAATESAPTPFPSVSPQVVPETVEPSPPIIISRTARVSEQTGRKVLLLSLGSVVVILALVYLIVLLLSPESTPTPQPPAPKSVVAEPAISPPPQEQVSNLSVAEPNEEAPKEHELKEEVSQPVPEQQASEPAAEPTDESIPSPISEEKAELSPPELSPIGQPADSAESPATQAAAPSLEDTGGESPSVPQPIQKRVPVDVAQRLQLPIASLKMDQASFLEAIRTLGDYSGIPFTFDFRALRLRGISVETPISFELENTTVAETLAVILRPLRLSSEIDHEQIFLSSADPEKNVLRVVRYEIGDILAAAAQPAGETQPELASPSSFSSPLPEIIPRLIAPTSWQRQGGEGTISFENDVLVVNQNPNGHDEIMRLLEQIRVARKLPQKTTLTEAALFPEQTAWKTLEKPITLHFYTLTPLAELLRSLERLTGLHIVVDHRALNEDQSPLSELKGMLHLENGMIDDAISQLLGAVDSAGLTYRTVDSGTIEITTVIAAQRPGYWTLEPHAFARKKDALAENLTTEELLAILKLNVEPQSWFDPGDSKHSGEGMILVDELSRTFFVRQSPPVQREIRKWMQER